MWEQLVKVTWNFDIAQNKLTDEVTQNKLTDVVDRKKPPPPQGEFAITMFPRSILGVVLQRESSSCRFWIREHSK